jgi:hypothetical protein
MPQLKAELKVIWVGNPFFAPAVMEAGVAVRLLDFSPGEYFDWPRLQARTGIEASDVLVLADKSLPPSLLGVEDFPCLTVFYSVDSHIHSWHPFYAQAFDLCLISLKDHLGLFAKGRLRPEQLLWTPPCLLTRPVSPDAPEALEKQWDMLFVGTVEASINPERVAFMEKIRGLFPGFHYCRGDYSRLYPRARLVLNHCAAGDLNFRVFEALGCGACLLTLRTGHGLEELFRPGRDLFIYDPQDIPGLLKLAGQLLAEPERRLEAARSGFRKVVGAHLASHRAKAFIELLLAWKRKGTDLEFIRARRREARRIHCGHLRLLYLHLAENLPDYPELREAYFAASRKD